jgi:hypothetical protein
MELGFETIGNATLICHDKGPVLVTDPWLWGGAYFGSWALSHEIPEEQQRSALACPYVWVSHGHPDHLSGDSLARFKDKAILLPNHFGSRVKDDLIAQGYKVEVLLDRVWTRLSPRIHVMCIPDYNQDALLLVDVGGTLLVNLNDASDRGWRSTVKNAINQYKKSFLLALFGYGDADMINYKTEDGQRIPPDAARKTPPGGTIAREAHLWGVTHVVPFSSMHKYQREDSIWASQYTTQLEDYGKGFESPTVTLTPAFIRYDVTRDRIEPIDPPERKIIPIPAKEFGDDWSEPLQPGDFEKLERYFKRFETIAEAFHFINFCVGGRNYQIELVKGGFEKGVTFEVPRHSLMTAIEWEVFDDLLIGNFMSTTLHGYAPTASLYPHFTPYVAKYGDNGRARTRNELAVYFAEYRNRAPIDYLRHRVDAGLVRPIQESTAQVLRSALGTNSSLFKTAKQAYWAARRFI